jgi:hypothetical protein
VDDADRQCHPDRHDEQHDGGRAGLGDAADVGVAGHVGRHERDVHEGGDHPTQHVEQ